MAVSCFLFLSLCSLVFGEPSYDYSADLSSFKGFEYEDPFPPREHTFNLLPNDKPNFNPDPYGCQYAKPDDSFDSSSNDYLRKPESDASNAEYNSIKGQYNNKIKAQSIFDKEVSGSINVNQDHWDQSMNGYYPDFDQSSIGKCSAPTTFIGKAIKKPTESDGGLKKYHVKMPPGRRIVVINIKQVCNSGKYLATIQSCDQGWPPSVMIYNPLDGIVVITRKSPKTLGVVEVHTHCVLQH